MQSLYAMRKEIIGICKRTYDRGYVAANDGNVSARISDDRVLATPTGMSKGFLTEDQLVLCDMDGQVVSGDLRPSSELKMHLMVYQERPDVNGVVHAHPPIATGFTIAGIPLVQCVLPEVVITLGSIPTAEYGTPSTDEIPNSILGYIQEYDAFLLANHGALTIGPDVLSAYHKMETMEHFAHITFVARQLGGVRTISEENVRKLMEIREKLGVKGRNPGCETCELSCTWAPQDKDVPGTSPTEADRVAQITQRVMAKLRNDGVTG